MDWKQESEEKFKALIKQAQKARAEISRLTEFACKSEGAAEVLAAMLEQCIKEEAEEETPEEAGGDI